MLTKLFFKFVFLILIIGVGGYFFVTRGLMPANADSKPSKLEKWAAKTSLRATLKREAPKIKNPVSLTDENLIQGIHLYAVNCAVCHGSSDGKASAIATGLFQKAPQLARHGVEDDPEGYTYWKIAHGIRFTGMPSFADSLTENEVWQLTLFLQHMDSLNPAVKKVWESVPSQEAAHATLAQETEDED